MGKRMLIDATHSEESRVAILDQDRLEDLDFETTTKKQLKGNIYLAKVIRIEPSLQAAFVEFGGNRHGFLAFSEIHPDYYRVPVGDREHEEKDTEGPVAEAPAQAEETSNPVIEVTEDAAVDSDVEVLGGEDVEELHERPHRSRPSRQYKIQEVLKRRQIMLVQVTKEERGGKGAALTTYLSLPGRYCVLMPNAEKGGGVSRKITNVGDRKRLREIIDSIELPESMSIIIRTAGMARNKAEIKKDSDYLMHLWNEIREKTLHSMAPALIYEEGNLIKRAIRDYYSRDISEILVEGAEGFREAQSFVQKIMPTHIKKIKEYKDDRLPLFSRFGVEKQIDAMHGPIVQLKSGGYIVFGTTEALVAIDVNSGRATRERHIEETAFKTNLEAAEEVARQLRLRDLAGLVVIDFIDMEDSRNVEAVERRLKDAMRNDKARVQVGKMSPFGLLELSRQRLRPNIIESTSLPCLACRGSGMIRSVESSSLHILRGIEEEAVQQKASLLNVYVPTAIALYILNQKRSTLQNIEDRWKISVQFSKDDDLIPPDFRIERINTRREAAVGSISQDERPPSSADKKAFSQRGGRAPQRSPRQPDIMPPVHPEPENVNVEKHSPSEDASSPAPSAEAVAGANKPGRRRFRKYDRRRAVSSGEEKQIVSPASPVLPAMTEGTPNPSKKVSARKGWWQKLLD